MNLIFIRVRQFDTLIFIVFETQCAMAFQHTDMQCEFAILISQYIEDSAIASIFHPVKKELQENTTHLFNKK